MPPSIPACHPVLQLITVRKIILRVHSLFKSRACYTIIALFMATFPSRPRFLPISTFSLTRPNQITEKPIQPFAKGAYTITERGRKKEEEEEQGHDVDPGSAYAHGLLMQHGEEGIQNAKQSFLVTTTGGKWAGKTHNQLYSRPIISLSTRSLI